MNLELRPIIGLLNENGRIRRIKWDNEILLLDGRQISTISGLPGAAIRLMTHVPLLSNSQLAEISEFVAKHRLGVPPRFIKHPRPIGGEVLDDEDEGEGTEVDESGDE